jgi:hypothetical protein
MIPQETAESAAGFDTAPAIATHVGYRAAHARVQAARGHASSYPCADCGLPAADWAYDHSNPDELVAAVNGALRRYSLDSDRYVPRCRKCHRRFDAAQRALREISTW